MVKGESAGCGCDGLDSGEVMTFLGDGDIKCAVDDPDGDGPHLMESNLIFAHLNRWFVFKLNGFVFRFHFQIRLTLRLLTNFCRH